MFFFKPYSTWISLSTPVNPVILIRAFLAIFSIPLRIFLFFCIPRPFHFEYIFQTPHLEFFFSSSVIPTLSSFFLFFFTTLFKAISDFPLIHYNVIRGSRVIPLTSIPHPKKNTPPASYLKMSDGHFSSVWNSRRRLHSFLAFRTLNTIET